MHAYVCYMYIPYLHVIIIIIIVIINVAILQSFVYLLIHDMILLLRCRSE